MTLMVLHTVCTVYVLVTTVEQTLSQTQLIVITQVQVEPQQVGSLKGFIFREKIELS